MVCVDLPTENEAVYEVEVAKVPKVEDRRGLKREETIVLKGWGFGQFFLGKHLFLW